VDLANRIRQQVAEADHSLAVVRALDLTVVTLDDPEYPERLRRVDMPPPLLFVRGSLAALTAPASVAVVGTRRPTDKGRLIAAWIGSGLARAGAVVVSGLAVGIDGAAHAAVVAERLPTVAVLGGGHARLFPKAHERLAEAIVAAGGAVVAELPPETPATRGTFPRRNRLVSGLSDATVVVEAGRHSGALITAGWALEQGRECFLVPGPLTHRRAKAATLSCAASPARRASCAASLSCWRTSAWSPRASSPVARPPATTIRRKACQAEAPRIGRGGESRARKDASRAPGARGSRRGS